MLLSVFIDYYVRGYLPDANNKTTLGIYFPNCNLAARRDFMIGFGMYTPKPGVPTAEDVDICQKAIHKGQKLFFEPKAICRHRPRKSIKDLIKQTALAGYSNSFIYKDYLENKFEIFYSFNIHRRIHNFSSLFKIKKFPFNVLIFLSNFFVFHLAAGLILLCAYWKLTLPASLFGLAFSFYAALIYLTSPLKKLSLGDLLLFLAISYPVSIAMLLGNIWGGLKNRMLFLTL